PGDVAHDYGLPGRHRLEGDDPERLQSGDRGEDEHVARREVRRQLLPGDLSREYHPLRDAKAHREATHRLELGPPANEEELRRSEERRVGKEGTDQGARA